MGHRRALSKEGGNRTRMGARVDEHAMIQITKSTRVDNDLSSKRKHSTINTGPSKRPNANCSVKLLHLVYGTGEQSKNQTIQGVWVWSSEPTKESRKQHAQGTIISEV